MDLPKFINENKTVIIIIFVIIIMLFIWFMFDGKIETFENSLNGVWVADENFCEESSISSMLLCLSEPEKSLFNTKFIGYLVMDDGESLICNQPIEMNYSRGIIPTNNFKRNITFK